jgi:hypothetical protein
LPRPASGGRPTAPRVTDNAGLSAGSSVTTDAAGAALAKTEASNGIAR